MSNLKNLILIIGCISAFGLGAAANEGGEKMLACFDRVYVTVRGEKQAYEPVAMFKVVQADEPVFCMPPLTGSSIQISLAPNGKCTHLIAGLIGVLSGPNHDFLKKLKPAVEAEAEKSLPFRNETDTTVLAAALKTTCQQTLTENSFKATVQLRDGTELVGDLDALKIATQCNLCLYGFTSKQENPSLDWSMEGGAFCMNESPEQRASSIAMARRSIVIPGTFMASFFEVMNRRATGCTREDLEACARELRNAPSDDPATHDMPIFVLNQERWKDFISKETEALAKTFETF